VLGAGIGDNIPSFCEVFGLLRHWFVCRSGARQGVATDALRDAVIGLWAEETTTAPICLNIIERKLLTRNRRTQTGSCLTLSRRGGAGRASRRVGGLA
jgi:hypothetical protein